MALVSNIELINKERHGIHSTVDCSASMFREGEATYLQLDTYGSSDRKLKGKLSQSLQFSRQSAEQLKVLIEKAFPGI